MAGYHWTREELIERIKSDEKGPDVREKPEFEAKWIFLNRNEFSTINVGRVAKFGGHPLHVHKYHDEIIVWIDIEEGQDHQVGDTNYKVKNGDIIVVPRGTPHTGRIAGVAFSIYAPPFDPDNPDRDVVE